MILTHKDPQTALTLGVKDALTFDQAAQRIGVSAKTLKRDAAAGKLVTTRIRGRVRIALPDWEEYLRQCRSVATVRDGKSGCSMVDGDLAKLLRLDRTPLNSKAAGANGSTIVALDERRATRLRKLSSAG